MGGEEWEGGVGGWSWVRFRTKTDNRVIHVN